MIALATLILFLPTPHGAYIAADSRHDGGDPALRDQARKIFLCGPRGVCAISGALRLSVNDATLDIVALLDAASQRIPEAPASQQAAFLASQLHAGISAFWQEHVNHRRLAQPLARLLLATSVSNVLFAQREPTGEIGLYQIFFPFRQSEDPEGGWVHTLRDPVIQPADGARPLAQGKTECMRIRPDQPPAVATRDQTLETIRALYQRTQLTDDFCRSIIGGPTPIAVIEPDGHTHWLTPPPQ
jgi:hypothetical protein